MPGDLIGLVACQRAIQETGEKGSTGLAVHGSVFIGGSSGVHRVLVD
jgi:hypothetical protein